VPVDLVTLGCGEHHRRSLLRGLCAASTLTLLVAACGSDNRSAEDDGSTSVAATQAEQLATQLDCADVTSADAAFENARWPFTESLDCWIDGRPSIRIHSFDADSAPEVSRRFGQRYGAGTTNPCPSGGALSPQFVVLGNTWAVVTTSPALRDLVVDRLQGVALHTDDNTTPVSYPAVDPCRDLPPITELG
jgi:hypothetical protein